MTVREALRLAAAQLTESGVPDPRLDAEYLLADLMSLNRLRLIAEGGQTINDAVLTEYQSRLARRARREPLQYILGSQPFMGHELMVSPDVLIPRADTEILCETALDALKRLPAPARALDLCTGSGALAIALKLGCPSALVSASDLSEDALRLARENAGRLRADIRFAAGDLLSPWAGERFDLIVSNPPYIPRSDLPGLQEEVLFEPAMALDGGEDGLDFYRRIALEAPACLVPGGQLMLEIGSPQARDVTGLLAAAGFTGVRALPDLAGLDRVMTAVYPG